MVSNDSIDHLVRSYGDLLFDLCETVLQSPSQAQIALRAILKKLHVKRRFQKYSHYERSWVLRITCDQLIKVYHQQRFSRISSEDQPKLDIQENDVNRLKALSTFLGRLMPEDQLLFLLKDKHGIPYSEISTALATPEASLKIRRQQALRALEEWLWTHK